MSTTRRQSKMQESRENNREEEKIVEEGLGNEGDTTIMERKEQELTGIEKLLQLMQLQSQQMDRNQQETKRTMQENQQESKRAMEETQQKIEKNQQEAKRAMEITQQKMEETQREISQRIEQKLEENECKLEKRLEKYENEMKACLEKVREETERKLKMQREETETKMKNIKTVQKMELEQLESKFENAIQEDRREIEEKFKQNEKQIAELKNQQKCGERREMIILGTSDAKIQFGGDIRKTHPVPFVKNLKTKLQHIRYFDDCKLQRNNIQTGFSIKHPPNKHKQLSGIFWHPREFIQLAGNERQSSNSNLIFLEAFIKHKAIKILIDSGSEISLINKKLVKELNLDRFVYKIPRVALVGANNKKLTTVNEGLGVRIRVGDKYYIMQCVMIEDLNHDMIAGIDELSEKHITINFSENKLEIKAEPDNIEEETEIERKIIVEKINEQEKHKEIKMTVEEKQKVQEKNQPKKKRRRKKKKKSSKRKKENKVDTRERQEIEDTEELSAIDDKTERKQEEKHFS
uniref:Calponin homology domain-containing protein DDB_G0272472-like n=1 Tax=Diabrotica virgifera virgifera TaxID=50390 RepID=A0A6P7FJP9_DIAVI